MSPCLSPVELGNHAAHGDDCDCSEALKTHLQVCVDCRNALLGEQLFARLKELSAPMKDPCVPLASGSAPVERARSPLPNHFDSPAGYHIETELQRGGQGVVYRGIQLATNRSVAIKILLAGESADQSSQLRFEREINIAASLKHPNIVTIYDSGVSQNQRYLAMEYIEGRPLDVWCRSQRAVDGDGSSDLVTGNILRKHSLRELLGLFAKIAIAVGYAHGRGVIHRDLKPGNILIDADGEPHILDFGLAKIQQDTRLEALQSHTHSGEFLGTLAYASPEQASAEPDSLDVRTDVYSLGVMLYEMLTGSLPYALSGPISDSIDTILHAAPVRPSLRCRGIDDELETIVLKSLSKDPARRYQTAEQFARDVQHYLDGEPIDAKRDSHWYVLGKSLHRFRAAVLTFTAMIVVITIALIGSLAALNSAVQERDAAQEANRQATAARDAEREQRRIADGHRANANLQSYIANIAAAGNAIRFHDTYEATVRLRAADTEWRGWEWYELTHSLDGSLATFGEHRSDVRQIAITEQSPYYAIATHGMEVLILDRTENKLIGTLTGPTSATIEFGPTGHQLAIGWGSGDVEIWDIDKQAYIATFQGPASGVSSLAFSSDRNLLAAAFYPDQTQATDVNVRIWNVESNTLLQQFNFKEWHVTDLAFSPDASTLAIARFEACITIDVATGDELIVGAQEEDLHRGSFTCVAYSSDGQSLATGGDDQCVHIWNSTTGELRMRLTGHTATVHSVCFDASGDYLISSSRDKTARVWDLASGQQLKVLCGHPWIVSAACVLGDTSQVLTCSTDGTLKLWDTIAATDRSVIFGHKEQISGLAFSSTSNVVASASWDHSVKIWNLADRMLLASLEGHSGPVQSIAFTPDGKRLVSAGWNGEVIVWDVASGKVQRYLDKHHRQSRVQAVAVSEDGQWLVTGSSHNELFLWSLETYAVVSVLTGHDDHIHSVVFCGAGNQVASAGHESIRVWDLGSREMKKLFRRKMVQDDFSLAVHPTSPWLAAGSDIGQLTIWDLESSRVSKHFRGHSDEIHAVAFSPDGLRMVSAAFDNRVLIWDPLTGVNLATLRGHQAHVNTIAFSPDGYYLVGGLSDGSLKVWEGASKDTMAGNLQTPAAP